eukprot:gene30326-37519_t
MGMNRRDFIQVLGIAAAGGMALNSRGALAAQSADALYSLPRYGNVHFLHFTDCHAQLKPVYFREPSVNIGLFEAEGRMPHLVGEQLLRASGLKPNTPQAHAFTSLNFERAAATYGKVGGFAHLATLVKRMKASRPGALLLDGGDTWQGSATALWTKGQDMVDACLAQRFSVPLMADEALQGPLSAYDYATNAAADVFAVKITQSGGLVQAGQVATVAQLAGVALYGGTMLEGGVGTAASAHLFATFADLSFGTELFGPLLLTEEVLQEPLVYKDFMLQVPTGPGLGVAVDTDKLGRLRRH